MKKQTFKLAGMHCTSCALMIESDLEDVGVVASCSYAKETVTVEYDPKKISEEKIIKTIQSSGYRVVES